VAAFQVTVTLAVLVPSVALVPVGAAMLRQPTSGALAALSPAGAIDFTQ
jgi:hypothetical protein